MKKKFAVLLTLAFILTSCARPAQRPLETNHSSMFGMTEVEYCRVTAERAEVKDGLGNNFNTVTTLNRNQIVRVLRAVGDRYVVQLNNNEIGSVDTADVTPIVKEDGDEGPQQPTPGQQPNAIQRPDTGQQPGNAQRSDAEQQPDATQRPGATQQPNVTQQPDAAQRPAEALPPQPVERRDDTAQRAEGAGAALTNHEQQMVDLVNRERAKNNLPALQVDTNVTRVARIKSQDMVDNNYFSHNSPTYGSPFDMLSSFDIKYLHAGENLAGNSSVERAHEALMNSSGHRKNILSGDFTHIGIGVKPSDRYGFIYTQMFISKPK